MNPATNRRTNAANLRHAATMILLREHAGESQVLMTLRHAKLRFMAGSWVFPGGALSDSDRALADTMTVEATALPYHRLDTLQGARLSEQECRALAIAACRETFEETGLLLARNADGTPCDADRVTGLQDQRTAVAEQPAAFADLIIRENLQLQLQQLAYWAHWITPVGLPRRFDTRFFAAIAPEFQQASADLSEATHLIWMSPTQLLAASRSGEMPIALPTRYNLADLEAGINAHPSLEALLAHAAHRAIMPVMPKLVLEGSQTMTVMPWDAEYDSLSGEGVEPYLDYREALLGLPSRLVVQR